MKVNKKAKWALVLSGGGAKGFAHVGVLSALAELGAPEPSLVAGTSMGAVVGGLYACGMGAAELTRFALEEFDINRYLDSFVFRLTGPMGKVFRAGQILGSLAGKRGVDSGERILALLERLTGGKSFGETRIPFRCNAVDLVNGEQLVFESGSVARAIRASMSFPFVFEPLIEEGRCLVDGGLADNMPVFIARKMGFSGHTGRILAVDVGNFGSRNLDEMRNAPQIVFRCFDTALNLMKGTQERADLTINAASSATSFSFFRKKELIALGEQVIRENIPALEAFFGSGPRAWLARRRYRECGIRREA